MLSVEDSGAGIAAAERERVLDRFYRVPGTAAHGSGLGLAIVNAVARQHGARLALDDSPLLGGLRVRVFFDPVAVTGA
ncbi:Swarming motility regulation sensor protein RssA [compost metagenome]